MIYTQDELIQYCEDKNKRIYDLVLEDETKRSHRTEEQVLGEVQHMLDVMKASSISYLERTGSTSMNLISGYTKKLETYSKSGDSLCNPNTIHLMALAFSTMECNASMGKIVASPTAGAAGIVPAVLRLYMEEHEVKDEDLVKALLTATGVGQIIGHYANFAGAEGGCQAETGSASAMGAAALCELKGATIEEILNAASITLINIMGLVCDPLGGIVEFPCGFRNASGAVNAYISADMARAHAFSVVPFEEVATAMGATGATLPASLRETGLGGVAGTPTGMRIRNEFFQKEGHDGE